MSIDRSLHLASVARFTLEQVVPHLVKLFLNPDEVQNRGAVLQSLADIIDAARGAIVADSTPDSQTPSPLSPYKDEVLGVLTVGLKVPSGCRHALVGLLSMANTPKLLTDDELGFVVHNVNELLSGGDVDMSNRGRMVDEVADTVVVSWWRSEELSVAATSTKQCQLEQSSEVRSVTS